jgi:PucR family transcriptional regulator, proline-responsive transcriptional activator
MFYKCKIDVANCVGSTMEKNMNLDILKQEDKCYSLKELLNLYSKYIKNPMVVINHNYELIYYTNSEYVDDVYKQATKSGAWSLELITIANKTFKNSNAKYSIIDSINKEQRRLFYKIEHGDVLGYLVLLEEKESSLENLDLEMIEHLSNSIGKILYLENSENNNKNIQIFYKSLLNSEYKTKDILNSKIKDYKIDVKAGLLLISLIDANIHQNNYFKAKLENILQPETIFAYGDNALIFLKNKDLPISEITDFLIDNHLTALYVNQINDYFKFDTYYKSLDNLLNFLKHINKNVLYYEDDYKMYLPFFSERFSLDEIINFINIKIFQIYQDDIINNSDNIDTLYYYLSYDKSLTKTSLKLFIHKNTVSYRLLKISDIYDIDFNDSMMNKVYLYSIFLVKYYDYKLNKND